MKRLDCLSVMGPLIKDDDLVVTTLGWVAGEWFAVRHKESNLYQVNMGMCTPLCLGLALVLPHRRVVAIESDGSVLLNLGAMTTLANKRPPNLTVIVFDNQCYMATGGLPTATAGVTDLAAMANGAGIETPARSARSMNSSERLAPRCSAKALITSSPTWKRPANE
jgi:thiamine pyrophosphate-dependent acetolactate synthase large subunit-like protein